MTGAFPVVDGSKPGRSAREPLISAAPPFAGNRLCRRGPCSYTELAVLNSTQRIASLAVMAAFLAEGNGGGNSWNRIRYGGGTVAAKVNPYDWNTTLTVTADSIVFVFGRGAPFKLAPSEITALGYGEKAYRHVADMVALSVAFVNPLVLFGILHQSKNHFISIEFQTSDRKPGVVLLEADKNNYVAILAALKTVTGKPVQNAP